jgi:hypothetical protein
LTVVLVLGVIVIVAAVVVGPTLFREGRAVVAPVVDMARSEEALAALDKEFPFSRPEGDAEVTEERLLAFLGVRRELKPMYVTWQEAIRAVEREHRESWAGAKQALTSTRDVITGQIGALRSARMSPAEFRWLEELVYGTWSEALGDDAERARQHAIRKLTDQDLEFLAEIERRHGSSPALRAMRARLQERQSAVPDAVPFSVPGLTSATQQLLWQYRDQIVELDLAGFELHGTLDRRGGTTIQFDGAQVRVND